MFLQLCKCAVQELSQFLIWKCWIFTLVRGLLTDEPNRSNGFQQIPPNHNTVLNVSQTALYFHCVFDSHTFIWHVWVISETSGRSDFPKIHFTGPQRPVPHALLWNCGGNRYGIASIHFQITKPENSLESHVTDTKTNLWSTSFTACFMYLNTILVFGKRWYILLL